jgi:hypothetical protein|tara:strand:- start:790 stop:1020 length:231 start_codon:yes stop_codon:yes gene_type:complete
MSQKTAKIIFSENEIENLIWALTIVKTMRLPIEPAWKNPYKTLLKELKTIKENLNNLEEQQPTKEDFYGKKETNSE